MDCLVFFSGGKTAKLRGARKNNFGLMDWNLTNSDKTVYV